MNIITEKRTAVRAIMVNEHQQMLLMRMKNPTAKSIFWVAPGGGIEAGEAHADALTREVKEETGLVLGDIGPYLFESTIVFPWDDKVIDQTEHFYLVQTAHFVPSVSSSPIAHEIELTEEFRWWSLESLKDTSELITPETLAERLLKNQAFCQALKIS